MNDPAKLVERIVFVVTSIYTVVLFLTHQSLPKSASNIVSLIPTVLGYGFLAFNRWIWKWKVVHWCVGRPRLDGTWRGTLQVSSESTLPATASRRDPRDVALVIEQTYFSVGVTLLTAESSSQSTSTSLRADADSGNRRVLAYTYLSTPKQAHRAQSPQHNGAARLQVVGAVPQALEGTYWTDRYTAGDMKFELVDRSIDRSTLKEVLDAPKPSKKGG